MKERTYRDLVLRDRKHMQIDNCLIISFRTAIVNKG